MAHLLTCLVSELGRLKTRIANQSTYTWPLHVNWLPSEEHAVHVASRESEVVEPLSGSGLQTQMFQLTKGKWHQLLHLRHRGHTASLPAHPID